EGRVPLCRVSLPTYDPVTMHMCVSVMILYHARAFATEESAMDAVLGHIRASVVQVLDDIPENVHA
ncbi:hypothetical protein EBZ70_04780, partial [bacterium]|nr:hypothetical protein [bacterium]